jgi:hypothetical protein
MFRLEMTSATPGFSTSAANDDWATVSKIAISKLVAHCVTEVPSG